MNMRTLAGALMWSLVPPPRAALRSSHTRSAEERDKGIKNVILRVFFFPPTLWVVGFLFIYFFFAPRFLVVRV